MPVRNDPSAVRHQIHQALADEVLSQSEADQLLVSIDQDGVTAEEVGAVIDTLKSALSGGPDVSLDISSSERKQTINRFLGQLNEKHALPLDRGNATGAPGAVNWLGLMTMQHDAVARPLGKESFSGAAVGLDEDGKLFHNGNLLATDAATPSEELTDALWALNKPGQWEGLSARATAGLESRLVGLMQQHAGIGNEAEGKFGKLVATNAAAGALVQNAANWGDETKEAMLSLAAEAPTPMMKALLLRGLEQAQLSPDQQSTLAGIEGPEHADELLSQYDQVSGESARVAYQNVKGEAAKFALSAMTFAKSQAAIDNVFDGMKQWKDLNTDYNKPWDSEELSNMNQILEKYVDGYPQVAFQFGTFSKEAPVRIAEVTNARVMEEVMPGLEADPPTLKDFPLSREQADYVKTLMPNVRDDASVDKMIRSLAHAQALFSESLPSSWGTPSTPDAPMSQAAFEMFQKAATQYQEAAAGSKDGKLDYQDFTRNFQEQVKELHGVLKPRIAELGEQPPRWGDVTLSQDAATYVNQLLRDHTRSSMSVDNIGRALEVVGQANGGKVEGAGFDQFSSILTDYMGNWPDAKVFDFNKLERIASYKVQGKDVPLCTINGQQIGLAEFYGKVGMDVSNAIDESRMRQPWMADRWGYRARQSIEVLDVVAEQTLRGEGPVALLREQYPDATVEIQATGRDGAHEQFVYVVKEGQREVGSFAQGSDGTLSRFRGRRNPHLFSATIGQEGELNVQVPNRISAHRFPLQTNYNVGDKIDVHWIDPDASEAQEKGETFSTSSRVLEAEILSYDASGNYTVKYTTPGGDEINKTLSLADIRRANNPHYFKPKSSYYSDVTINLQTDEALRGFLEEAQPIIDRHLPSDGSLIDMSPQELTKRQKACIKELMAYTRERVKYPASKDSSHSDDGSKRYHELDAQRNRFPLGDLVKIGKGVCRHQCILEHLLLQQAGIDSRLASGSANTSSGNFRGYHIWTEVSLADDTRFLSDQTWNDAVIPLWEGAYSVDKERVEMYRRTARYDHNLELAD